MNTLKNRKEGDTVYYKFIKLIVKTNLGDKMICEYENGNSVIITYSEIRLPLHKYVNNLYEHISSFRNKLEQRIINSEHQYMILVCDLLLWVLAFVGILTII